jgi:hypothetical protein
VLVAPSNAGWLAAWNADHVFVSTDAGRTFTRVLDGPGPISDVGFDCFGTVVVVRKQLVGLRVGGDEGWSQVPGVDLLAWRDEHDDEREGHAAVVGGGPEVVIVGRVGGESWNPRVARSGDLGGHWRYHDLEADWETPVIRGRQEADGSIHVGLPSSDCAGDSESVFSIRGGVVTDGGIAAWPELFHAVEDEERPAGLPEDAVWVGEHLARAGDALYRVRGARARRLPLALDPDDQAYYLLDGAGRVWTVRCGQLLLLGKQPSGVDCSEGD